MAYEIKKKALKQLNTVSQDVREKIIEGMVNLPQGDIKKLKGLKNTYRLRVGDYRVMFTISGKTIVVGEVLQRKDAYKNL